MNKNPDVRGHRQLRRGAHRRGVLHRDRATPSSSPSSSVIAHLLIGLGVRADAELAAAQRPRSRPFFRVIYILPWLFTAAIDRGAVADAARAPNGVVNYLLVTAHRRHIEWLASTRPRARGRDVHQHLGGLPVLHDQPARRPAGHPRRPLRGGDRRRSQRHAALLQRHPAAAAPDHHQHGAARPDLDLAAVRPDLDDDRRRSHQRHRDAEHLHLQARVQPRTSSHSPPRAPCSSCCSRWCSPSSTCDTSGRGTEP